MSTIKFPNEKLLRTIVASGKLDEVLNMYATILVGDSEGQGVPDFCKDWLHCLEPKVNKNKALRKAVFYIIFTRRKLANAPVETYWDIACRFGPTNQTAVVNYLNTAPKSVPLKLGRLLLAKAEFGVKSMPLLDLQQVLAVLFASPAISQGVITREWLQELGRLRGDRAELMAKMGKAYAPDGPVYSLVTLFPQITADKAHLLLVKSGESVEQLTQKMLDIPDFVSNTLGEAKAEAKRPKKYVVLDNEEKQRRADELRQKQRLTFSHKYTTFEEEDPDPEAEDTTQQELSEADMKLVAQEQLLWSYWHSQRSVFDRQSRKSETRKALKAKLKWTDEQIEGWGRVSARSPTINGKENFNVPKHVKEVESYVPALRQSASEENSSSQNKETDVPSSRRSEQKPRLNGDSRQKNTNRNKKDGAKQASGNSKPPPKPSQQQKTRTGVRKSGKAKSLGSE